MDIGNMDLDDRSFRSYSLDQMDNVEYFKEIIILARKKENEGFWEIMSRKDVIYMFLFSISIIASGAVYFFNYG